MLLYSKTFRKFMKAWPGKKYLGEYRFLPIFFVFGAALEYSMINWHFGGEVNFYRTFKKRQIDEIIEKRERLAPLKDIEIKPHY